MIIKVRKVIEETKTAFDEHTKNILNIKYNMRMDM